MKDVVKDDDNEVNFNDLDIFEKLKTLEGVTVSEI